ncbi:amidohydrolase family protein [Gimesia sp.]|uniref:amidohydrolase family protein n=1 Tax=Gimesia sp. TaxID=2024833 RepID=UPI000C6569D9|nr:amidohydrolase family protein [Gimesia sp.]MAX36132.1 amidohydrolase [Gimesia sp.]|tara:strand:+ start:1231 stop:2070 length:840 start_codon:yes stop_codon:yes gene_type:complete
MEFIDAHSHVWTPDVKKYPLAPGYEVSDMKPPSFTAEELQAEMKPVGVNRVVLIQMSFYGFDNSYMLDCMAKYPGMFSGVAVIDQNGDQPTPKMLELKKKGVRGFRIRPQTKKVDEWLDGECMEEMWSTGAKEGMAMCCLMDAVGLPALDKMCQKHRDTTVVIDHLARIGVTGEIDPKEVDMLCKMAKHPNVYVKVSAFYALGKKQMPYHDLLPLIEKVYQAFGANRLMWATDCPYQVQGDHSYQASIGLVRNGLPFLSGMDKEWILEKTAEKVFFQGI